MSALPATKLERVILLLAAVFLIAAVGVPLWKHRIPHPTITEVR